MVHNHCDEGEAAKLVQRMNPGLIGARALPEQSAASCFRLRGLRRLGRGRLERGIFDVHQVNTSFSLQRLHIIILSFRVEHMNVV